jgi:hypothetical protein
MTAIFRDVILEGGRTIGTILSKLGIVRAGVCLFFPRSPSCTTIGHSVWCAHLTYRQLPPHTLCQWLRASVCARHRTRAVAPARIFSCAALVARVLRFSWKCAIKDYHASGFAWCACQGVAWVRRSLDTFIPAPTLADLSYQMLQTLPIALLEDVKKASCGAAAARFCRRTGDNLQPPGGRMRSERG